MKKIILPPLILCSFAYNVYSQSLNIVDPKYIKPDSSYIIVENLPDIPNHFLYKLFSKKDTLLIEQVYVSRINRVSAKYVEENSKKGLFLRDGSSKLYFQNGKIKETTEYRFNGQYGILTRYYPSGKTQSIQALNLMREAGKVSTFYENDIIQYTVPFLKRKIEGTETQNYPTGKPKMTCQYKDGKRNGTLHTYYPNGQIKRVEKYKNGKLLNSNCFSSLGKDTIYYPFIDSLKIINPIELLTHLNKTLDSLEGVEINLRFNNLGKIAKVSAALDSKNKTMEDSVANWIQRNLNWRPLKIEGQTITNEAKIRLEIPATIDSLHYSISERNDFCVNDNNWSVMTSIEVGSKHWIKKMPEYPGGIDKMMMFLYTNINYPALAANMEIMGKVILQFIVDKDGSITNISLFQSVHPLLDAEAIRVVSSMPKWVPGMVNHKTVPVFFTLPIIFQLKE